MNYRLLLFISFIAISLLTTACGKDEETDVQEIEGSYKLTNLTYIGCGDPEENIDFDFGGDGCVTEQGIELCLDGFLLFKDGTIEIKATFLVDGEEDEFGSTDEVLNYTLDGENITICDEDKTMCETGTIKLSGNTVTLSITDSDEVDCTITFTGKK